jgi:membrane-bound ClpP family serine protease
VKTVYSLNVSLPTIIVHILLVVFVLVLKIVPATMATMVLIVLCLTAGGFLL